MVLKNSLVSVWQLNESSGNAIDSYGSNTLIDNGTVGSNSGVIGTARDFEFNNSEYFSMTSNSSVEVADIDFQFSFWIYLESIATVNPWILGKWRFSGGSYRNYAFYLNSTNSLLTFGVSSDGASQTLVEASNFGPMPTGTWIWVQGGHNSVDNNIFISVNNGAVNTTNHSAGVITDSNASFLVGSINIGGGNYWDGRIEQIAFWKRTITDDEKSEIYNNGLGLAYSSWDSSSGDIIFKMNPLKSVKNGGSVVRISDLSSFGIDPKINTSVINSQSGVLISRFDDPTYYKS